MRWRPLIWTVFLLIAAAVALSGKLDDVSQSHAEDALKKALVTFGVARTLNGVISAAQGTELALEPGGVGVTLSVGEVLDPINDLIERFSGVMLIAASSIGLQLIVLEITSWWGVTAVLVAATVIALIAFWWPGASDKRFWAVTLRVLLVTLFVRFAVPVLIVGTAAISNVFLAPGQQAATEALEATSSEIEAMDDDTMVSSTGEDRSLMDRLGKMLDDSIESINVGDRIRDLKDKASNASEHIVELIAIFVLQTIIMPLAFLWLFFEVLKSVALRPFQIQAIKRDDEG